MDYPNNEIRFLNLIFVIFFPPAVFSLQIQLTSNKVFKNIGVSYIECELKSIIDVKRERWCNDRTSLKAGHAS